MYNETTEEWFKDYKIEKEIRYKKNKTKIEKLYIDMNNYNSIALDLDIDYSKKHFNKEKYNEKRLKNRKNIQNIYYECTDINSKIKNKIKNNCKISNFEQMFINEFKELQNNFMKDLIIYLSKTKEIKL